MASYAAAAGDLQTVTFEARSIKSAAGNLGAARLAALFQEPEDRLDLANAPLIITKIRRLDQELAVFASNIPDVVASRRVRDAG